MWEIFSPLTLIICIILFGVASAKLHTYIHIFIYININFIRFVHIYMLKMFKLKEIYICIILFFFFFLTDFISHLEIFPFLLRFPYLEASNQHKLEDQLFDRKYTFDRYIYTLNRIYIYIYIYKYMHAKQIKDKI